MLLLKTLNRLFVYEQDQIHLYQPGDTVGILPVNLDNFVNKILDHNAELKAKSELPIILKLIESSSITKKPPKIPIHLPRTTTSIYKLLKEAIDLNAIPKKGLLAALAKCNCISDPEEKRYLEILASREGAAIYVTEILQKQTPFIRLLDELKSISFSVKSIVVLFEHLPRLMPRPYSIASSALATKSLPEYDPHSTLLKIIFSVNDPPGITSCMLERLIFKFQVDRTLRTDSNEDKVNMYFRETNRFRLNDDDFDRPLILIAIGTGVAPFIGFLEHRREQMRKLDRRPGHTWLLFGCRHEAYQLCRSELKEFSACGVLNHLTGTFSRDIDANAAKYVQDGIKMEAEDFVNYFAAKNGTKTFVCGSRKMTHDVRCTIEECLAKVNKINVIDAKAFVDELGKNGRYIEDVWF